MQQVEFARAVIGRDGVGGLVPRVTDELFRRDLPQGPDQLDLGLRAWWGEQGDLVTPLGEPVGQQRDYPFDAAVAAGRNGIPGRSDDGDAY
jgi:hypothetical protein